ncbi:SAM-dependent methyltransferase [Xanthobacter autotrophicus]|uniref:SAM-dependent methyltransferase n=1 Tax=Xanthobacter autotrophicus TaxID=280 RepID=UPI0024A6823A|nr:SAM-dependent methyltransferase [Xanthobacter autotrophicus]MDI4655756.1 SAM-dependent methyltransferase [Xanthobacter autotrophicus]
MTPATFSDDWLSLREPADHRSRNMALEAELVRHLEDVEEQRIVDLGAGSGSNLRALALRLGPRQHWVLMDYDGALADAARARLKAFADKWREAGDTLVLTLGAREIRVDFAIADLARDPAAPRAFAPHLVTASAFHDLVSADWCASFAEGMAGSGILIHAALICDGQDAWAPPHPADAAIAEGFRAHQGIDKGFGPALGPQATQVLGSALTRAGYDVGQAQSPWRLVPGDRALMARLAAGTAAAAMESGRVDAATAQDWARHRADADACAIGHLDLLAVPRG